MTSQTGPISKPTPSLRVPPQSIEAEMATLGSLLLGGRDIVDRVVGTLSAPDFYRLSHGEVFDAITHLYGQGEPIDLVTVQEELSRRGKLESCGGQAYLFSLVDFVPTPASVGYYASVVTDKASRRRLIELASEVAQMAYGDADQSELEACAQKLARAHKGASSRHEVTLLRDVLAEEFAQVGERFEMRRAGITETGIMTGLLELDDLLTGLKPGEVHLVAARPGNGKSALAVTCAMSASRQGSVLFASLEMSKSQLAQRILSGESKVDSYALRTGAMVEREWEELSRALQRLWDMPLYVATVPALRPSELMARSRKVPDLRLIVVDYVQLMGSDERGGRREEELALISRTLKEIAMELSVPVIALAQLNRDVEKRPDKRPLLADLRESGALEQDADAVWMIYRPSYYAAEPSDARLPDPTEILVRKNRMGPVGVAKVGFIASETRFVNLATEQEGF